MERARPGRVRPVTLCVHPGCRTHLSAQRVCVEHGGDERSGRFTLAADLSRFIVGESSNPWAAVSPDCPRGHHARRVYRWSYDPTDPFPWLCVECQRRFAEPEETVR